IPQRIEEDYHSIKDDIPLVSVYTTGDVRVRAMLIPDTFLIEEIRATDDFKEYETVFMTVDIYVEWGVIRAILNSVDDDDEKRCKEGRRERKEVRRVSLETRIEKMQCGGHHWRYVPRTVLSSEMKHLRTESPSRGTVASQDVGRRRVLIQNHGTRSGVAMLSLEGPQSRLEIGNAFRSESTLLLSQEFKAQAPKMYRRTFKGMYVLKKCYSSSIRYTQPRFATETTSSDKAMEKDPFFLKYGNTEEKKYILSFHTIHAERFPEVDLEEKMNRWIRKEFKNFNEDARLSIQHWKDSWHKEYTSKIKEESETIQNTISQITGLHKLLE
ncbi:hypothetical protein Tco_1381612, partial [Tanacetum coccineum]